MNNIQGGGDGLGSSGDEREGLGVLVDPQSVCIIKDTGQLLRDFSALRQLGGLSTYVESWPKTAFVGRWQVDGTRRGCKLDSHSWVNHRSEGNQATHCFQDRSDAPLQ